MCKARKIESVGKCFRVLYEMFVTHVWLIYIVEINEGLLTSRDGRLTTLLSYKVSYIYFIGD